jgi:hypothetical protein
MVIKQLADERWKLVVSALGPKILYLDALTSRVSPLLEPLLKRNHFVPVRGSDACMHVPDYRLSLLRQRHQR